jgi:hypothetical protein
MLGEERERLHTCGDCLKDVPAREGDTWRWYDFYAAQGDEELFLCIPCWQAPRHQQRLAADRAAEKEEFCSTGLQPRWRLPKTSPQRMLNT